MCGGGGEEGYRMKLISVRSKKGQYLVKLPPKEETTTGNLEAGKLYEKCTLSSIKININELKINIKTNAVQKKHTTQTVGCESETRKFR